MRHVRHVLLLLLPTVLGGCSIRATTDQILDTTSNVTGTTSSTVRSWFSEDGLVKPEFQTRAFVTFNRDNVTQDLAAGRGEYLSSVSVLLGVPQARRPAFFSAVQGRYATGSGVDASKPATLLALLQDSAAPFLSVSRPLSEATSR